MNPCEMEWGTSRERQVLPRSGNFGIREGESRGLPQGVPREKWEQGEHKARGRNQPQKKQQGRSPRASS